MDEVKADFYIVANYGGQGMFEPTVQKQSVQSLAKGMVYYSKFLRSS